MSIKNGSKQPAGLIAEIFLNLMNHLNDYFIRLSRIMKEDQRFQQEAYLFVMASLGRALRGLEEPRHISGAELLASIREEAEEQFGPMSTTVLHHWGIKNSLDFGEIVFNMVREGILSKTEDDRLDDFKDSVFFKNLFDLVSGYQLNSEQHVLKSA